MATDCGSAYGRRDVQTTQHVGDPSDPSESERIEWVPVGRLRELVRTGHVTDGLSLTALSLWLAFGDLGQLGT